MRFRKGETERQKIERWINRQSARLHSLMARHKNQEFSRTVDLIEEAREMLLIDSKNIDIRDFLRQHKNSSNK